MGSYNSHSDEQLLSLLGTGDQAAFAQVYDRYWQLLFRFARKLLQDEAFAGDVVQEVFTVLWIKRGELLAGVPLAAYLYKLTKNKILDMLKHSKVEGRYLEHLRSAVQLGDALPDELYIEKELYDQIEREIALLPERMRQVFEMSKRQYKSNREIASELGLSEQTVKNQVSSATKILRSRFGDKLNVFFMLF